MFVDTQHSLGMRDEQLGGFVEWVTCGRIEKIQVHRCCHKTYKNGYML